MIIDKEEVIFASDQYPNKFSIKNQLVANLLQNHFELIWKNSKLIKSGSEVRGEELDYIKSNVDDWIKSNNQMNLTSY